MKRPVILNFPDVFFVVWSVCVKIQCLLVGDEILYVSELYLLIIAIIVFLGGILEGIIDKMYINVYHYASSLVTVFF